MLGKLSVAIFLVVVLPKAGAKKPYDLCAGCTMINGAGYKNHPYDCDKFIQCHLNEVGELIGEVRNCPFSTYWDMSDLTCQSAKQSQCPNDKCANRTDGTEYTATLNCRGYWRCENGKSQPMCCPIGKKFECNLGCINAIDCSDRCFSNAKVKQGKIICPNLKTDPEGFPNMYAQFVLGRGWVRMRCARGTVFQKDLCGCNRRTSGTGNDGCRKEVHLTFSKNDKDESGNRYYVRNENVEIKNGVAEFNGYDSRLIIPRFTNLDSETVVIQIKYISDHMSSPVQHAILSNSDCGNIPSIFIAENATDLEFGVMTSDEPYVYTSVKQAIVDPLRATPTGVAKNIAYTFSNGVLTGSNRIHTSHIPVSGHLHNVQCALHIGYAEHMAPFKGLIDEITVYLCNPDLD